MAGWNKNEEWNELPDKISKVHKKCRSVQQQWVKRRSTAGIKMLPKKNPAQSVGIWLVRFRKLREYEWHGKWRGEGGRPRLHQITRSILGGSATKCLVWGQMVPLHQVLKWCKESDAWCEEGASPPPAAAPNACGQMVQAGPSSLHRMTTKSNAAPTWMVIKENLNFTRNWEQVRMQKTSA